MATKILPLAFIKFREVRLKIIHYLQWQSTRKTGGGGRCGKEVKWLERRALVGRGVRMRAFRRGKCGCAGK